MHFGIDKKGRLFAALAAFFLTNALLAEFLGTKVFALESSLGSVDFEFHLFGRRSSLDFTTGVLLWPFVFVTSDVINEYFGRRGVRHLTYLTVALITYAFFFAFVAIHAVPADWWVHVNSEDGVPDMQLAFGAVFGQGLWVIAGSLIAFLLGQLLDVAVYHRLRRLTGERRIWLRATGSTLVSQLIDSFVVLYVAFVCGPQRWSGDVFLAVGSINYAFKFFAAIAMTPLIYLAHMAIDCYLGDEAQKLKAAASEDHSA